MARGAAARYGAGMELRALQEIALTRTLTLLQRRRGHRTATDDVLCAWAGVEAAPNARRILDLGAGHGAVTLMLAGALPEATLVGLEVQAISVELLRRNVRANDLEGRVAVVHGDLRATSFPADSGFDLITGSPPFMRVGAGTLPRDPQRAGGRFELRGGVEDYLLAAARWLAVDGVASILMDGLSDQRTVAAIAAAGLVHRRTLLVRPRAGEAATYRVYSAARSALPSGPATKADADAELVIREGDSYTAAFEAVRRRLDLPGRP